MNVQDWRKPEYLALFTDGELSYLILKGKGRMPAFDGKEIHEQVWAIVNCMRSMSASGEAPKSWLNFSAADKGSAKGWGGAISDDHPMIPWIRSSGEPSLRPRCLNL
jgi:hypothetical protein